mmetsp:Transcript_35983/g.83560  ORF Transcript_35983/g.83560 Transcript_35983/m.83560 type:complete len:143 (+) Transcript_35983:9-437(+)
MGNCLLGPLAQQSPPDDDRNLVEDQLLEHAVADGDADMLTEEQIRLLVEQQISLNAELDELGKSEEQETADEAAFIEQGKAAVRAARERMNRKHSQPVPVASGGKEGETHAELNLVASGSTPPEASVVVHSDDDAIAKAEAL